MSSHEAGDAPDEKELQFENPEYDTPTTAVPCVACKQDVGDAYYELNGHVFCPGCRAAVDASRTGGSRAGRFIRALVLGGVAAFGGFLIYFGVMKLADMEIGLISILVGFMVGTGVRKGSSRRGGWFYQLLAVFLTYSAIAASYSAQYLPAVLAGMNKKDAAAPADPKGPAKGANPANAKPADQPPPNPGPQAAANPPPTQAPTFLRFVVLLGMLMAFCYTIPIIAGFQQPIGLLIVVFALWEAWKLNKSVPLVFNGPFQVNVVSDDEDLPPEGAPSYA